MRAAVERHLRAGDRPHAERLRRVRELERAVDAVVVGERERLVSELRRARRELLRLRRAVEERVRRVRVELDVTGHLGCRKMVEIGEGERHLRQPEARRHAPRGHRAARRGRRARRSRLGKFVAARPCTARRGAVRLRGRAHAPARGSRASRSARDLGVRPARDRAHVRGDGRRAGAVPRPPRSGLGLRRLRPWRRRARVRPASRAGCRRRATPGSSSSAERAEPRATTITDRPERRATVLVDDRRAHDLRVRTTARASAARRGTSIASTRTRSSSSTGSSRSTCATARTRCRRARSSSSRPASCTASTTTRRAHTRCLQLPHAVVRLRRLHARAEPRLRPVRPARGRWRRPGGRCRRAALAVTWPA